ncbi:MAG: hypothetical protein H6816_06350 [Phycisphaerales bacterium]|nr:hypothetical protein [Phycisphaerales bacterium]
MRKSSLSNGRPPLVAAAGLLALWCAAPAIAAEASPSITQFVRMRWPINGTLAPDGSLYCVNNPDGTYQLYRQPAGASELKKLTAFPDGMSGYALSHDGKWAVVAAGVGGNEQDDLYLLDTATDELVPILVDSETVFGSVLWRRDSQAFAYRANKESKKDFNVYIFNLATRTSQRVLARPGYYYPADFNRAGDHLVVGKYMSATQSQLFEVDLKTGATREITPADEAWSFSPVGYTADEKDFLVATDYHGDLTALRRIDLASGKITPLAPELDQHEADGAIFNGNARC